MAWRDHGARLSYNRVVDLGTLPLFERLAACNSVLLAGAGGGFDIFAGLPLYAALRKRGIAVHLANLSFSRLDGCDGRRLTDAVVEVGPDTKGGRNYFPELHLARWLRERGEPARIFAFEKVGVVPLRDAYSALASELSIDALVLVDGGSDSLLTGDEAGLGTPAEDMASIAAVDDLAVETKLLLSIGFGVDSFHGVSHGHVLETVSAIAKSGGFLGAFSLMREMDEFAFYKSAVETVNAAMAEQPSIVNASIVSAVEGDFGDVHRTHRTRGSTLWINPLMAMYFAFELGAVARRVGYLSQIKHTRTMFEISAIIEAHQRNVKRLKPWSPIPI